MVPFCPICFDWELRKQGRKIIQLARNHPWWKRERDGFDRTQNVQTITGRESLAWNIPIVGSDILSDLIEENGSNNVAEVNLPETSSNIDTVTHQPEITPVYDWNSITISDQVTQDPEMGEGMPDESEEKTSNIQMLDLIDVENEGEAEKSKTQILKEENEILKKKLEAENKECIVCYEYDCTILISR